MRGRVGKSRKGTLVINTTNLYPCGQKHRLIWFVNFNVSKKPAALQVNVMVFECYAEYNFLSLKIFKY